jgi:hypothetical protein
MKDMLSYLAGGDLRSIGRSNELVERIKTQSDFDNLVAFLFSDQRLVVMRAADTIEKLSRKKPEWVNKHANNLIGLLERSVDKELKWHLALISPRLSLKQSQVKTVWNVLSRWALDETESKIVRVNALQGLYELAAIHKNLKLRWTRIISQVEGENTTSLKARLRKLRLS